MKWPLLVVAIACTILVTCDNSNTSRSFEWYSSFVTNAYEGRNNSIARDSYYGNKHEEKTTSSVNINEAKYITEVNNTSKASNISDGNIYEEGNTNIYEMNNIYSVSNFTDDSFIYSYMANLLNASNIYRDNNSSNASDIFEIELPAPIIFQFVRKRPERIQNPCSPGFKLIDSRCRKCYGNCS